MNEHQRRLWQRMMDMLDAYVGGLLDLKSLINGLEAAFHASEIRDCHLESQFMRFWNRLDGEQDIAEALGVPVDDQAVRDCVHNLQHFLKEALADQRGHWAS